jgi:tyrosine-protein phosphatase YwqE
MFTTDQLKLIADALRKGNDVIIKTTHTGIGIYTAKYEKLAELPPASYQQVKERS